MVNKHNKFSKGMISGWTIATIGLSVATIGLVVLSIWLYMNYQDQKNNVDSKVSVAVAQAKKSQADNDETKFEAREKIPNKEFVGPDDYGRLTFYYPKTWSAYIGSDVTSGGNYSAYLNPDVVPYVSDSQQFALRVTIEQNSYDSVISNYSDLVKTGKLSSSSITINGHTGTRLDGDFSETLRGSAVIFKIRDKTLTVRTDLNTFKADFENVINTINFNA